MNDQNDAMRLIQFTPEYFHFTKVIIFTTYNICYTCICCIGRTNQTTVGITDDDIYEKSS